MKYQSGQGEIGVIATVLAICAVVVGLFFALPAWNVWRAGLSGEADLRQATQNRQIAIQEAKAKHEAASELAAAEIERAKGVAQANIIIGNSLKDNQGYLRYLWIEAIHTTKNQVIYIPTEGGLPILEAGKRP